MVGKDPRRLKLYSLIARECKSSLMDESKWHEALIVLKKVQARFRVKLLTDLQVSPWDTLVVDSPENYIELPNVGPVLCLEVEWLEIDPITRKAVGRLVPDELIDNTQSIERALGSLGLPFSKEGPYLRLWAHLRNGQDPNFV